MPILWLGFLLSISFMEAWLKFQAVGITQQIGLSIGKLIFGVLNKVELFFFLVIAIVAFSQQHQMNKKIKRNVLLLLGTVLFLQTFYLLPILDGRADMIINGEEPAVSYFHFYYVALEVLKVILLINVINKVLLENESSKTIYDLDTDPKIDVNNT